MNRKESVSYIEEQKAVAVLRLPSNDLYEPVVQALYEGGIRVLEITMTVPNALELIRKAAANKPDDLLLGVGSVLDSETTKKAVDAGARFVVSPITKREIIETANELDVAVTPGAFTPTEVQSAWEMGADIVKVFPADVLGMAFFKGIKAPMPHLKLMPTGGVSLTNGNEWIAAGASAVGLGSALVDKKSLADRNFDQIRKNAQAIIENLKNV